MPIHDVATAGDIIEDYRKSFNAHAREDHHAPLPPSFAPPGTRVILPDSDKHHGVLVYGRLPDSGMAAAMALDTYLQGLGRDDGQPPTMWDHRLHPTEPHRIGLVLLMHAVKDAYLEDLIDQLQNTPDLSAALVRATPQDYALLLKRGFTDTGVRAYGMSLPTPNRLLGYEEGTLLDPAFYKPRLGYRLSHLHNGHVMPDEINPLRPLLISPADE